MISRLFQLVRFGCDLRFARRLTGQAITRALALHPVDRLSGRQGAQSRRSSIASSCSCSRLQQTWLGLVADKSARSISGPRCLAVRADQLAAWRACDLCGRFVRPVRRTKRPPTPTLSKLADCVIGAMGPTNQPTNLRRHRAQTASLFTVR